MPARAVQRTSARKRTSAKTRARRASTTGRARGARRGTATIRSATRRAREILRIEAAAVQGLIPRVRDTFKQAMALLLRCKGRVVVTGMGKPGFIAQKMSATLASTGTPSLWLHPAEAIHGDLGRVTGDDVVIALSNSGETEEILRLIPLLRRMQVPLIGVTGNVRSTLARQSAVALDVSIEEEACPLGLAPSASTTALLAMCDAIALTLSELRGFREEDFARYHPGGALGKRVSLTVGELMRTGRAHAVVTPSTTIREVLVAITQARSGSATVVDRRQHVVGLFTDGDLRRHLKQSGDLMSQPVDCVMTRRPTTITPDRLAAEAARIMEAKKIDELPVIDGKRRAVGLLDVQDLLRAGLVAAFEEGETS